MVSCGFVWFRVVIRKMSESSQSSSKTISERPVQGESRRLRQNHCTSKIQHVLNGFERSRVVSCGFVWFRVVPCGFVWFRVVSCGFVWFQEGVRNLPQKVAPIGPAYPRRHATIIPGSDALGGTSIRALGAELRPPPDL